MCVCATLEALLDRCVVYCVLAGVRPQAKKVADVEARLAAADRALEKPAQELAVAEEACEEARGEATDAAAAVTERWHVEYARAFPARGGKAQFFTVRPGPGVQWP